MNVIECGNVAPAKPTEADGVHRCVRPYGHPGDHDNDAGTTWTNTSRTAPSPKELALNVVRDCAENVLDLAGAPMFDSPQFYAQLIDAIRSEADAHGIGYVPASPLA